MVGRIGKALWLEGKACRLAIDATATGDGPISVGCPCRAVGRAVWSKSPRRDRSRDPVHGRRSAALAPARCPAGNSVIALTHNQLRVCLANARAQWRGFPKINCFRVVRCVVETQQHIDAATRANRPIGASDRVASDETASGYRFVRERTDVRIVPLSRYRRKRPQRSSMKCRVSMIAWQ